MPAPRATTTSAPKRLELLDGFGGGGDARLGAVPVHARPQSACASPGSSGVSRQARVSENQEGQHEGDIARRAGAAQKAGDSAGNGDEEAEESQEPVAHDAAHGEAEQQIDDVDDADEGEVDEALVARFVRGVIVAGQRWRIRRCRDRPWREVSGKLELAGRTGVSAIGPQGQRPVDYSGWPGSSPAASSAALCRAASLATRSARSPR